MRILAASLVRAALPASLGVLALAGCKPEASDSRSVPQAAPTPIETIGISQADKAAIYADAKARLLQRSVPLMFGGRKLCSDFFSLGDPIVGDAALGDHTGKVKLIIPITVYNSLDSNGQKTVPDVLCYGYSHPGWQSGQPYNVSFQFDVERWQSGWRVSQIQSNGF